MDAFPFEPGQFVSCIANDSRGKQQTRAYSVASAPKGNAIELCVNRVPGGFFSNLLCDLKPGDTVELHGPHGMFTLHQPVKNGVLVAADTGVAPMRAFVQWLFPQDRPSRSENRPFTLVYGTQHQADLYYREEFEHLAAKHPNFAYLPVLTGADAAWKGARGALEEHAALLLAGRAAEPQTSPEPFETYAYLCGLNAMVAPCRERLKTAGLNRKQTIFERYD